MTKIAEMGRISMSVTHALNDWGLSLRVAGSLRPQSRSPANTAVGVAGPAVTANRERDRENQAASLP